MIVCLLVFSVMDRYVLTDDLKKYISTTGLSLGLDGNKLPIELRNRLKTDLVHNPRELEEIPGLKTGMTDTGTSFIYRINKTDFVPGSYKKLENIIKIENIAGGLKIINKKKTRFEFVTTEGKIIKITRDVYYMLDLSIDLILSQRLVPSKNNNWFKINDEKTVLEINNYIIYIFFDSVTRLYIFYFFVNVNKTVQELETNLYFCVTEKSNQNLTRAKKKILR